MHTKPLLGLIGSIVLSKRRADRISESITTQKEKTITTARSRKIMEFLILSALTSACASGPQLREIVNSFQVSSGTPEHVYTATVQALADLDFPLASTDRATGTIATDWVGLIDGWKYTDCGSPGFAHSFRNLEARVSALVSDGGEHQDLKINATFRADRWEGGLAQRVVEKVTCVSTGELESTIHKNVEARLGSAP